MKPYLLTLFVFFLSGCTTPTNYQPLIFMVSFSGGYKDTVLENDEPFEYSIYVKLNKASNIKRARDFALWRAAELAKENDIQYFNLTITAEEMSGSQVKMNGAYLGEPQYTPKVWAKVDFIDNKEQPLVDSYKTEAVLNKMISKYQATN